MTMPANQLDETMPAVVRDRRLLQRYTRDGSEPAFHELVERHLRLVYATCLRELGDAALAEDAAQIVFMILARKAPSLMLGQSLAGWLFVTARYTSSDLRRRELRRKRHETDLESVDPSSLRYEDFAWSFIDPNLNDALMSLGKVDRDAVLLRFFEERSYKEVAEHLSLSEAAAERRVARALVKLRRQLVSAGFAASISALGALLLERSAHAVAEDLSANVLKIASGSPHAYPALLTAKAASIAHRLVQAERALRVKIGAAVVASTAGFLLLYGVAVVRHAVPKTASTRVASSTSPANPTATLDPTSTPAADTDHQPKPRPVHRPVGHGSRQPDNRPNSMNSLDNRVTDGIATASSLPVAPPPPSTVATAAKPGPQIAAVPPPPPAAVSMPAWTSATKEPTSYVVVPIPDNDPQSQSFEYRQSGKDFIDADRPVSINDNGDILYRCGDVYHWDGSRLAFEHRTVGLPRQVIVPVPTKTRRDTPRGDVHIGIVQQGRKQVAIDAPDTDTASTDDDSTREQVILKWQPSVAASIDDSGDVLGINQSGVFIEAPGDTASYVCKPGSIVNIAACDFQARLLDDGRVAANLTAAQGDLSDVGAREVSFSYAGSQVADLGSVVDVPAGFQFADANDAGLAVGNMAEGTAVCVSAGRSYKLGGLDNFVHAPLVPRGMNSKGEVVGYVGAGLSGDGVLWERGKALDLNDLIRHSRWRISRAFAIDSRGDILAYGRLGGRECPVLLVPGRAGDQGKSLEASN